MEKKTKKVKKKVVAKKAMDAKKAKKGALGLEEKTLIGIVAVSAMMIIAAFLIELIPTPSERADAELAEMADEYYLTYLYPRIMSSDKDLAQAFKKYDTVGVPTVLLRQLLHHSEENAAHGETFKAVGCNTNTTGVRYYPKAPYGPHDYTVEYRWGCSEREE